MPRYAFLCALVATLPIAACSSDSASPQSCAYAVGQDLDAGRYDDALERLASRACAAAMSPEAIEMDRAAAYIGKAGYDVADILRVVTDAEARAGEPDADVRLLESLTGLGAPDGLRHLDRANAAYQRMMTAFQAGLDDACREASLTLLSPLQLDACFHSGLLAYARLTRAFDLLLQNQLAAFLGLQPLDCDNDRDFSGVADEAEVTACALQARTRLGEGGGVCREPGTRDGQAPGGVAWARIAGVETLPFYEDGTHFASLVPVRVTTEAGGACEARRDDVRLLQPRAGRSAEIVVTGGLCETEIARACGAVDADLGCWPCPIPRATGAGAMSVTDTLLTAVNFEAERALPVITDEDRERVREDLEAIREGFCEDAAGSAAECESEDGRTRVNLDALREYFRR